ncbi:cytochrome b [Lichenibacterium dinghuense]|jgi:cytochrome b561|uniref:cytochrome b n=1 Tax=Lichenibacterium dinghuense TaxID=2895977 RepID=UPI001F006465|nr:cytochrome b/b6 domain-containing protein [Lichenibacterium sp. 6Y81]
MTTIAATRYDRTTILLHWATALLIVALWILGQTSDWFPDGSLANESMWSTHVVLGFALAGALACRLVWRTTAGRRLPAADGGALHVLAKATHYGLYLLLLAVVTLGVANAFVRGYGIYGLFHLPQVGDRAWRHAITDWHGFAANVLLGLAALHAAAALVHHYVWHDGLIGRMAPTAAERPPLA